MKYCKVCNCSVHDSQSFCTECGNALEVWEHVCPNCQNSVTEDTVFCTNCGTQIDANTVQENTLAKKIPYFSFKGRVSLKGFWMTFPKLLIPYFLSLFIISNTIDVTILTENLMLLYFIFGYIVLGMIAVSISMLSFEFRRAHDMGRSGWGGGLSILFVSGTKGPNKYGPDPRIVGETPGTEKIIGGIGLITFLIYYFSR